MALTENDLKAIQEKIKKAEADTTPFVVVDGNGDMSVVGDVNKTQTKQYDYTVKFRIPSQYKDMLPGATEIAGGKYYVAEVEYKNVMISARKDLEIVAAIIELYPFLRDVLPSGDTKDRSPEELKQIISNYITKKPIVDAMYHLVSAVVGVDDSLADMMLYSSVFDNVIKIIEDFPEIFNETDFFTGQPS